MYGVNSVNARKIPNGEGVRVLPVVVVWLSVYAAKSAENVNLIGHAVKLLSLYWNRYFTKSANSLQAATLQWKRLIWSLCSCVSVCACACVCVWRRASVSSQEYFKQMICNIHILYEIISNLRSRCAKWNSICSFIWFFLLFVRSFAHLFVFEYNFMIFGGYSVREELLFSFYMYN